MDPVKGGPTGGRAISKARAAVGAAVVGNVLEWYDFAVYTFLAAAPTYASVGLAGPLIILVARLMQGFSAGGEWGGSTAFIVEWAPEGRRGFYGSFQQCSVAGGFLLGGILGPVGIWMRRTMEETPAYAQASERGVPPAL